MLHEAEATTCQASASNQAAVGYGGYYPPPSLNTCNCPYCRAERNRYWPCGRPKQVPYPYWWYQNDPIYVSAGGGSTIGRSPLGGGSISNYGPASLSQNTTDFH